MNSKNISYIKVLATIAMILQGTAVLMSVGVVMAQHALAELMRTPGSVNDVTVYPPSVVFKILIFILFFLFFRFALIAEKEIHRTGALLLIIFFFLFDISAVIASMVSNYYYSIHGEAALAMYSTVSALISYATIIFEIPAAPLFFIAYGRYAAQASFADSLSKEAPSSSFENI